MRVTVMAHKAAVILILTSTFIIPSMGLTQLENERLGLRAILKAIPGLSALGTSEI